VLWCREAGGQLARGIVRDVNSYGLLLKSLDPGERLRPGDRLGLVVVIILDRAEVRIHKTATARWVDTGAPGTGQICGLEFDLPDRGALEML
jgi:hypothetical protein